MSNQEVESLRRRVEHRLGWDEGSSEGLSLRMLQECVRGKSPKLEYLLEDCIRSSRYIYEDSTS